MQSLPGSSVHGISQTRTLEQIAISYSEQIRAGVPKLWDLMPNELRWSWCNNNRNKVYNKCNALESSWNHTFPTRPWNNYLAWPQSLVPKRLGAARLWNSPPCISLLPAYQDFRVPVFTFHKTHHILNLHFFLWSFTYCLLPPLNQNLHGGWHPACLVHYSPLLSAMWQVLDQHSLNKY